MWLVEYTLASRGSSKMHPKTLNLNSCCLLRITRRSGRVHRVTEIGAVAHMRLLSIAISFEVNARLNSGHGTV